MKNTLVFILSFLVSFNVFAEWGDNIMSVDAIKHWRMDDRVVHVRGTIIETFGSDGFKLADDTGEIRIHFTNQELRDFRFDTGMRVEIKGLVTRERHHRWDLEATNVRLHDGIIIEKDKF